MTLEDVINQPPPFIVFEIADDDGSGSVASFDDECTFFGRPARIFGTIIHRRGHFVAFARFSQMAYVQQGIYYYDDLMCDGTAYKKTEFDRIQRPTLVVYQFID
jgi:hypothetical protein